MHVLIILSESLSFVSFFKIIFHIKGKLHDFSSKLNRFLGSYCI